MPKISSIGRAMPSSPIRKLMPYANAAKASGKRVIHLNIGQPDIATPEVALLELKADTRTFIEYSPSEGYASYRDGLSSYYKGAGIDVNADEIVVTTGGSEALVFVPVTATIEDGFELPPISDFEKLITPRTKAILICNPGNPTGKVYAPEAMNNLAQIIRDNDLYLFSDEVYREFCYDGAVAKSVLQLDGIENNVVLIDSVSKRYSMCGARIGALITKNNELKETVMKFAMTRLSPPTFGQIASEAALKASESYFEDVRTRYVKRRDLLVEGLNSIPGVTCPKPGGAFYAVCKLPIDSSDAFCQWMLEHFSLDGDTVMMAPASGFYATDGAGSDEVRIAYVLDLPLLEKAVECLKLALEQYPGRTN